MLKARVRKASKHANHKRKLLGVIRLEDNWIGKTMVVLTWGEYKEFFTKENSLKRRLRRIERMAMGNINESKCKKVSSTKF